MTTRRRMSRGLATVLSVRGRLTIVVTLLFAVVVVSSSWFLLNLAESAWIDDVRAQDLAELEELAAQLDDFDFVDVPGTPSFLPLPVGVDGTVFTLTDAGNNVVAATPVEVFSGVAVAARDGGVEVTALPPIDELSGPFVSSGVAAFTTSTATTASTNSSLAVELDGDSYTLAASSPLVSVEAGVDSLQTALWVFGPLLAVFVGWIAWMTTGRAIRPVAAITTQVERITHDSLDERVPVPASRDEVAHLARTMNTMLDRLSSSQRRQREFVSDASHELRNPVATSRAALEVALAHLDVADWEQTARMVLEEQSRLSALVEDLLLLARIDEGVSIVARDVDLDDLVRVEAARPHLRPIDVAQVEPARVRGDERQLTRVVRNLVDNAVKYAGTRVVVSLRTEGDECVLVVEDDGPGIPPEDRERVLERFVRRDDSRTRSAGGSGLGLAIVQVVLAAHDGTVTVGESSLGGARVSVRLPMGSRHG